MNNRERELRTIVNRINRLSGELTMELRNLSDLASEIYGETIVADLCSGSEIEFRRVYGSEEIVDDYDCIRMEKILDKIESNKR